MKYLMPWILFFLCLKLNAQNTNAFTKGKHYITIGHGYKSWYQTGIVYGLSHYEKTFDAIGPIHIKYEYRLSKKTVLGISMGYHHYMDEYKRPTTGYRILAKMNYHFFTKNKLDIYGDFGIGLGSYTPSYSHRLDDPSDEIIKITFPVPEMEFGIGTRFYFSKNIGLYMETGIGKTIFQSGIAIRF